LTPETRNGSELATGSRQLFDTQSRELHPGTGVMILQADKALLRTVGVLELADLLAIEPDGDRRTVGFNLIGVPPAARSS